MGRTPENGNETLGTQRCVTQPGLWRSLPVQISGGPCEVLSLHGSGDKGAASRVTAKPQDTHLSVTLRFQELAGLSAGKSGLIYIFPLPLYLR